MRKEVEHCSSLDCFSYQGFQITSDLNADIEKRQIIEENQVKRSRHSTMPVVLYAKEKSHKRNVEQN